MSFLGSIGSFIGGAVNKAVTTVLQPKKLTTAVLTGGLSVVAPRTFLPVTNLVGKTLFNPTLAGKAISLAAGGGLPSLAMPNIGAPNMGLNLGNLFSGLASGVGTLLSGGSPSQALSGFTNFLPGMGSGSPFGGPTITTPQFGVQTMGAAPAVVRGVATVGRSFFNRFPNLAAAIQMYRNTGKKITRAKLYSLMKRFGPEFLISGGILTAAAVSELMVAGPGSRRMNPGNVKALRRSLRRLESFHHLCQRVDKLRVHRRRGKAKAGGSATFVRQG